MPLNRDFAKVDLPCCCCDEVVTYSRVVRLQGMEKSEIEPWLLVSEHGVKPKLV
jgi:hypothetical protein